MTQRMIPFLILRIVVIIIFGVVVAWNQNWLLTGFAVLFLVISLAQLYTARRQMARLNGELPPTIKRTDRGRNT